MCPTLNFSSTKESTLGKNLINVQHAQHVLARKVISIGTWRFTAKKNPGTIMLTFTYTRKFATCVFTLLVYYFHNFAKRAVLRQLQTLWVQVSHFSLWRVSKQRWNWSGPNNILHLNKCKWCSRSSLSKLAYILKNIVSILGNVPHVYYMCSIKRMSHMCRTLENVPHA